jgi:hypothetical protein
MFWDIAFPVLAAIAQALTGFFAWRVTVDGVKQERKLMYEWLFAVATIVGVVSVGIAAYRGTGISHDLAELRSGQQTTNAGIQKIQSTPPAVVNVNPPVINFPTVPQHTHAQFLKPGSLVSNPVIPFHENQTVALNVTYANGGDYTIDDPVLGALLELVPVTESAKDTWGRFGSAVKLKYRGGSMLASHNPMSDYQFRTFARDEPLSKNDADDLMAIPGKKKLCAIGKLRWRDNSGKYETRCLMCAERELDGNFSWAVGSENNAERKLSH